MGKRIIAVNAGPRMGWNTETLISEASKGAESMGAEVERFDLFRLEKYTAAFPASGARRRSSRDIVSAETDSPRCWTRSGKRTV